MSIVMKTKMTAAALAVCSVMGLGYSTAALADGDSVDFTTTINVDSVNKCEATVSKGDTGSDWTLGWSLTSAAGPSSIDHSAAVTTPLEVKVTVNDGVSGDTCHLNNMVVAADMGSATQVAGSAAYKVSTSNGFWRYMPVVAQAQLFTDTAYTSAVTGTVNVKGADGSAYPVAATAKATAYATYTPPAAAVWGSNDAVVLSDGYVGTDGYAPLTVNGTPKAVSFTMDTAGQNVDSAIIGMSAVIATDPEDATGSSDVNAVVDGETVTMPFTINVTWA